MTLAPTELSDHEKLEMLRRLDRFRDWVSLDEIRYCLVCGKLITGREIQIKGESSETESPQAACPTEYCNSIPIDWALPTHEILDVLLKRKENLLARATN